MMKRMARGLAGNSLIAVPEAGHAPLTVQPWIAVKSVKSSLVFSPYLA